MSDNECTNYVPFKATLTYLSLLSCSSITLIIITCIIASVSNRTIPMYILLGTSISFMIYLQISYMQSKKISKKCIHIVADKAAAEVASVVFFPILSKVAKNYETQVSAVP